MTPTGGGHGRKERPGDSRGWARRRVAAKARPAIWARAARVAIWALAARVAIWARVRVAVWAAVIVAASALSTGSGVPAANAASQPSRSPSERSAFVNGQVKLIGHGYGHGRGAGQWGALGYAVSGQSYSWILDHYYGGTTMAVSANSPIRVRIDENSNNDVIVTSTSAFTVATSTTSIPYAAGTGAMMRDNAGSWTIYASGGCAGQGGWTAVGTSSLPPVATPASMDPNAAQSQLLQLCMNPIKWYRGQIQAADFQGASRTVNILPIESYLRGVVPSESPDYWATLGSAGPQGQPQGFQALEVQAVAARSYALSGPGSVGGYADICDTTSCQVYGGELAEAPHSDIAIADTAGQVRLLANGAVARTEFSSSTGGYTAGGQFPAVVDDGDAASVAYGNPNHNWTDSINVSDIQAQFPQIGALSTIEVTARNGLGDLGGRVESLTVIGSAGSVKLSGDTFAADFSLRSNWFEIGGTASGGIGGYWEYASDGGIFNFGNAHFYGSTGNIKLNKPVVGMAATPDGGGYWLVASDGGIFSFGNAHFYGSTGAIRLNRPIVGMSATPDGGGYWLVASDGGIFSFGNAHFYGSTGAIRLAQPMIGMARTPDGGGYWLVAADGGIFNYGDAAFDGSLPGIGISGQAVGIYGALTGSGYLMATAAGKVYSFGDAPIMGDVTQVVPGYPGGVLGVVGVPG
ncbi:MAG: SpoIID/LytB domain-containing protein [Acidimicrobiales bacterium]